MSQVTRPGDEALPSAAFRRLERACDHFEDLWKGGGRHPAERFLGDTAGPERAALLRELLAIELRYRVRAGEEPTRREYRARLDDDTGLVDEVFDQLSRLAPAPVVPGDADPTLTYVAFRADGTPTPSVGIPGEGRADGFAPGVDLEGRYRLERELGRGGMGVVYLGHDRRLGRPVAIKVVRPASPAASGEDRARLEAMFADEARLGASLSHPAIATVHDFGRHGGSHYTVFEFVPGETLRDLLRRRGRLPLDEVSLFLAPVAQALDVAHALRVVHRDLKPENIRVTPQGQFKVLDLGLARHFDRQGDWRFAGTPAYASPEQAAHRAADGRADQYALAVIAFEMLCGRRPFLNSDPWSLLSMHEHDAPPDPRPLTPGLPDRVAEALLRALSKDPNRRFGSCEAFARAMGCRFLSDVVTQPEILLEADVRTPHKSFHFQTGRVHLALTPGDLWVEDHGQVGRWTLVTLLGLHRGLGRMLSLTFRTEDGGERLEFRFARRAECVRWFEQLEGIIVPGAGETHPDPADEQGYEHPARRKHALGRWEDGESVARPFCPPVVVLQQDPNIRYQILGPLDVEGASRSAATAALRVRAAMLGADALVGLRAERRPRFDRTTRRLSGVAARMVDPAGRLELVSLWFGEEAVAVGNRMLVVVAILALAWALLRLLEARTAHPADQTDAFGLLPAIGLAQWAWLLVMAIALRWLRWPQLAPPAALTFAGAAIAPLLGILLGGLVAVPTMRDPLLGAFVFASSLLNPLQLTASTFQWLMARRAWRAYDEYVGILPAGAPEPERHRVVLGSAASMVAGLFIISLTALTQIVGFARLNGR